VNLNGKGMYLEPGTAFCPYGFVRWNHTEIDALKLDRKAELSSKLLPWAMTNL